MYYNIHVLARLQSESQNILYFIILQCDCKGRSEHRELYLLYICIPHFRRGFLRVYFKYLMVYIRFICFDPLEKRARNRGKHRRKFERVLKKPQEILTLAAKKGSEGAKKKGWFQYSTDCKTSPCCYTHRRKSSRSFPFFVPSFSRFTARVKISCGFFRPRSNSRGFFALRVFLAR